MDELFFPTSSSIPPSPASVYSASLDQVLQFAPCEVVLEPWRAADDVGQHEPMGGAALGDGGSSSVGNDDLSGNSPAPAATAAKRRGRKAGPRSDGKPAMTPVEAERQRRDKLNRRFCELRAAVPTVSRLDRASLLADAAGYIAELRRRVEQLEAKVRRDTAVARHGAPPAPTTLTTSHSFIGNDLEEKLEVRMVRPGAAALRLTTAARHAPARLMDTLRSLDLTVQHACICRIGGVTVHDAVVDVPAAAAGGLQDDGGLRAALLFRLQVSG